MGDTVFPFQDKYSFGWDSDAFVFSDFLLSPGGRLKNEFTCGYVMARIRDISADRYGV